MASKENGLPKKKLIGYGIKRKWFAKEKADWLWNQKKMVCQGKS